MQLSAIKVHRDFGKALQNLVSIAPTNTGKFVWRVLQRANSIAPNTDHADVPDDSYIRMSTMAFLMNLMASVLRDGLLMRNEPADEKLWVFEYTITRIILHDPSITMGVFSCKQIVMHLEDGELCRTIAEPGVHSRDCITAQSIQELCRIIAVPGLQRRLLMRAMFYYSPSPSTSRTMMRIIAPIMMSSTLWKRSQDQRSSSDATPSLKLHTVQPPQILYQPF